MKRTRAKADQTPTPAPESAAPAADTKPAGRSARARTGPAAGRAPTPRRTASAPGTFEPTGAARSAAGEGPASATGVTEPPTGAAQRPRPVRAGAPGIGPHDGGDRQADERERTPGTEIAVGMIRAAGEFTRLSISAWSEFVKRAARRR